MHATDVAVVQLVVKQSAVATVAANVVFERAKSMPIIVTLAVIEATLYGANVDNTGAEEQRDVIQTEQIRNAQTT